MNFVKSADTSVPVGNSRAEMEKMLRRYGAVGFNVQQTFSDAGFAETITVQFIVPDKPGSLQRIPISLPVNVLNVAEALYPVGHRWREYRHSKFDQRALAQAERVAWRNLVLWIDAALSAASIGLQTIKEAFYAHTVIPLEGGGTARLADYIEQVQGQLAPGVRALLASPAETE